MSDTLVVNEIYLSLQGESTFAGLPCVFVRLAACNLRCSYCDTAYAFAAGKKLPLAEVRQEVGRLAAPYAAADVSRRKLSPSALNPPPYVGGYGLPLVELTGGEPLLQANAMPLM